MGYYSKKKCADLHKQAEAYLGRKIGANYMMSIIENLEDGIHGCLEDACDAIVYEIEYQEQENAHRLNTYKK